MSWRREHRWPSCGRNAPGSGPLLTQTRKRPTGASTSTVAAGSTPTPKVAGTCPPAALPKTSTLGSLGGAKQLSYMSSVTGYAGPCPPAGAPHTYQFEVFALDEATLSGVTATSTRANVVAAIVTHKLGSAKLAGTFAR